MVSLQSGPEISVILPVFNEEKSLEPLIAEIVKAVPTDDFEIIAVDDGSTDGSAARLESMSRLDGRLNLLRMGENRGQSAALLAGFDASSGKIVATMDSDGQNDPADLPAMLSVLGSDPALAAVVGVRSERVDSCWKRFQGFVANRIRDVITGDSVTDTGCSLRVVRRHYIDGLPRFEGMHRFIPTLIRMQGGLVLERNVGHRARVHGRSHYGTVRRATKGFKDALRVRAMLRHNRDKT